MTPIVGPIKLIGEGLTIKDGEFSSLWSAGIGVGLVTLDGFYFTKQVINAGSGYGKAFLKFMTAPVLDGVAFMRSIGTGTFTALKMAKNGYQVLKAGEYMAFGKEALKFAKGTGVRFAGVALLAYLGYQLWSSLFDTSSAEEQQRLAEVAKMEHDELEKMIQSDWAKLSDEEKAQTIKLATAYRMGITNLDLLKVKKVWNQIAITFSTLVNYADMKQVEADFQSALWKLDATQDIALDYKIDGGELKYQLLARKEEFQNAEGKFDKALMKNYLSSLEYPEATIEKMVNLV